MKKRDYLYFTCGQIGVMTLTRYLFQWLLLFVSSKIILPDGSTVFLFSAATVGSVLLGFRIFDGISDPIAGALSDQLLKRGRKRHTLMMYSISLPCLGLALCFYPNFAMSETWKWLILLFGMTLFFVGYTFYAIPYWSSIDDLAEEDLEIRQKLSTLLGVGLLIATAIGFIVTPLLVDSLGYFTGACAIAVFSFCAMAIPFLVLKNTSTHTVRKSELPISLKNSELRAVLRNKKFLASLALFCGSQMSLTIMTSAAPFIAIKLLNGSEKDVALLMGPLLGSALLALVFVPKLSKHLGWEKLLFNSSILLAAVYIATAFLGVNLIISPIVTAAVLFSTAGPMVAVLLGVEGEAISTCARESGRENTAQYFGVYNFFVKLLNGAGIFFAGLLVAASQNGWGTSAVRAMPISAGLSLIVGILAYGYFKKVKSNSKGRGSI